MWGWEGGLMSCHIDHRNNSFAIYTIHRYEVNALRKRQIALECSIIYTYTSYVKYVFNIIAPYHSITVSVKTASFGFIIIRRHPLQQNLPLPLCWICLRMSLKHQRDPKQTNASHLTLRIFLMIVFLFAWQHVLSFCSRDDWQI